jgi:hypothetical protein
MHCSYSEDGFTCVGFKNRKKTTQKFKEHELTASHRTNIFKFQNIMKGNSVVQNLNDQFATECKVVRESLHRIFTSMEFLVRQGLGLRGHEISESNFYQLFVLRTEDSVDLRNWMKRKTTWTSTDIQEEIINSMGNEVVRKLVVIELKYKYFSIIADETADVSRVEQLCVCLRTTTENLEVEEMFLGLYALDKCDGASIFNATADIVLRLTIPLENCRGATFDGASAFKSKEVGVGARLKELEPSIIQTHCHMHCVNLSVQDVVNHVAVMRDFLQFAQQLITFLRDSPKRCAIARTISE